jgi:alpha 1,2-mannosyltransferase
MEFWRSEAYMAYFEHLDQQGGFYYEVRFPSSLFPTSAMPVLTSQLVIMFKQRWGDAPVHTIGAALFQSADRIHFFRDIGYQHYEYMHCPTGELWRSARCACNVVESFGMTD